MGNTSSQSGNNSDGKTYSKISDHLNDLLVELIKLETIVEFNEFIKVINALIQLLSSQLLSQQSNPYRGIPINDSNLKTIQNWQDHISLLHACYFKTRNNMFYIRNEDRPQILRSLLTIIKYCSHQKAQVNKVLLDGIEISTMKNQVDEYFIENVNSISFPNSKRSFLANSSSKITSSSFSNPGSQHSNSTQNNNTEPSPSNLNQNQNSKKPNRLSDESVKPSYSNYVTPSSLPPKSLGSRRLDSERRQLLSNKIEGVRLSEDLGRVWILEIDGAKNTLYENETFTLKFTFEDNYPIESPEVVFIKNPPIHPHIYSNGYICLSILYDNWSPALGVSTICMSLISMLSSCKEKRKPPDDTLHSKFSNTKPKQTMWLFHDDKI